MSKRFTDTEKWKSDWFLSLSLKNKVLWQYICDNCDHCGIWKVSLSHISFSMGEKVGLNNIFDAFGNKLYQIESDKFFIPSFIKFQYDRLQPNNPAHKGVFRELSKYFEIIDGLVIISNTSQGAWKGLDRGFIAPLDKTKTKTKNKAKDKEKEERENPNLRSYAQSTFPELDEEIIDSLCQKITVKKLEKLISDYGPEIIESKIMAVIEWEQRQDKNKRPKDYNLTIRNWLNRDGVQKKEQDNAGFLKKLSERMDSHDKHS